MTAIQLGAPEPEFGERPATYLARLMALNLGRRPSAAEPVTATLVNGQR